MPNELQGQIEEMCRDLAVEVKRMRQLQDHADELRTVIRQWAGDASRAPTAEPASRGRRR
jgi:hypothetical protein